MTVAHTVPVSFEITIVLKKFAKHIIAKVILDKIHLVEDEMEKEAK